jgi:hypothetical protein
MATRVSADKWEDVYTQLRTTAVTATYHSEARIITARASAHEENHVTPKNGKVWRVEIRLNEQQTIHTYMKHTFEPVLRGGVGVRGTMEALV